MVPVRKRLASTSCGLLLDDDGHVKL